MNPKYFIYTDASFSHLESLGVSGFLIFDDEVKHEQSQVSDLGIRTHFFKEVNNIRAEIVGAIHCLKTFILERKSESNSVIFENLDIKFYSDCQTLTNLLGRREKLESTNYISARKKSALVNTELYKAFFQIYDELKPTIHWVKGHTKKESQNLNQKNFELVDKQVRKELRALIVKKNK